MHEQPLNTPVAFIIFNRPDTTRRVFAEIARARPRQLLVIADGARPDRPGEAERCAQARAVIDAVDWDCEVLTNYSERNLGCRQRVSSGLDWVFATVGEAIILEDDCLPHPDFFRFCAELLDYYRDDERIGMISGDNFQNGARRGSGGYYFSRFNHIWGWASWRRAWQRYDVNLTRWPELRDSGWLEELLGDRGHAAWWNRKFQSVYDGFDTWDYQWTFACWVSGYLTVLPDRNLVSNIGFGPEGTHTRRAGDAANLPVEAMDFPLRHPGHVSRDVHADAYTTKTLFSTSYTRSMVERLRHMARLVSRAGR